LVIAGRRHRFLVAAEAELSCFHALVGFLHAKIELSNCLIDAKLEGIAEQYDNSAASALAAESLFSKIALD
jgi:hypothetical protein